MFNVKLLPDTASTFAAFTDPMYWTLFIFTFVFTTVVLAVFIYLGVKFKQEPGRPSRHIESLALELTWTIIPTILAIGIFVWGAVIYFKFNDMPANTYDIGVVGKQWMWKLQHPGGNREVNKLTVPVGQPVKLTMTSQDVLHDFYVPAFRVKQDVLPARYTTLWFEATKTGVYPFFCAEYCGTEHSMMVGEVHVLSAQDFAAWQGGDTGMTPVEAGSQLFTQMGCATCHAAGDASRGPQLNGIFGHTQPIVGGTTVTVDEEYLRESIINPGAKIVEGYAPLMPNFANQLSEDDVANLIAYIKSLTE